MLSSPYSRSAACALWVSEAANVSIVLNTKNIVYSISSLAGTNDFGLTSIFGKNDKQDQDFSIAPLVISSLAVKVGGFSVPRHGVGPAHSGRLMVQLHMWASEEISKFVLGTDEPVDVRFGFGDAEQLMSDNSGQSLVKPLSAGGTEFYWPGTRRPD